MTLFTQLPATYPKTSPILRIERCVCGNPSVPERIREIVNSKPRELLGNEMVFEIACLIQDVLEDAAGSKARNEGLTSLEAEREHQRISQNLKLKLFDEARRRHQEEAVAEEDKQLADQIKQEVDKKDMKAKATGKAVTGRRSSKSAVEDLEAAARTSTPMAFPRIMNVPDKDGHMIAFSKVVRFPPKFSAPGKKLSLVVPQTSQDIILPNLFLKDLYFVESSAESASLRQRMIDAEELLAEMAKHRHRNVVDLLGYKVDRTIHDSAAASASWELSVLTEHAQRGSLSDMLEIAGNFEPRLIRSYTKQILEALEFFDQHGYVHPAIHLNNILFFASRDSKPIVKISDGYGHALKGILENTSFRKNPATTELLQWTAPELRTENSRRCNKSCIWEVGRVVLEMAHGSGLVEDYASPEVYLKKYEDHHTAPFRSILVDMFQLDPKKRSKAFELRSFQVMQEDDIKPILKMAASIDSSTAAKIETEPSVSMVPSRFKHDFEHDMSLLGKGAYGKVFKAKHQLDGRFYAVKEVASDSPKELQEILRETILLSRLNHPYVVRYFSAWMEIDQTGANCSSLRSINRRSSSPGFTETDSEQGISDSLGRQEAALDLSVPHDIMSNSSLRDVVFGYETDEDGEIEDGDTSSEDASNAELGTFEAREIPPKLHNKSQPSVRTPVRDKPQRTRLYIQMEFCENRTLRHLINEDGLQNAGDGWRIFRQVLDGISHVHKVGIIHRDLKPENIFIDNDNNPRIGDFGLATSGTFPSVLQSPDVTQSTDPDTRDIGTTFYVAPELSASSGGQYTSKVDMYSLGIMFFEICQPRMFGQQRTIELNQIRQKVHKIPPFFQDPDYAVQGEVIMMLLTHHPHDRPSAADLFRSGKIPEPVEDEKLRKFVASMADSDSPEYEKLLSSLFAQKPSRAHDYAWHRHSRHSASPELLLMSSVIRERLTSIFCRHGAVETKRKLLFPRSEHYKTAATLLGPKGTPLQLAYDLTLPNALALSHERAPFEKIFCFGTVYRESLLEGEPKDIGEIDFDIVSYTTADLALKEAESIKVLDEIVQECPPSRSSMLCFHLNHSDLLNLVLDFCKINQSQMLAAKEAISRLHIGNWTWEAIRTELHASTNISSASLEDLMRFNFRGDLDTVRRKVEAIFGGSECSGSLGPIFTRIETVLAYLQRLRIRTKLYIHPLSCYNDKFYRGNILFQCLVEGKGNSLLAVGGRYDALIAEHAIPSSEEKPRAVGFHLPWDELNSLMLPEQKNRNKKPSKHEIVESGGILLPSRCDVLVTSFDPDILRTTAIELLQQLWADGISAELSRDFGSMTNLLISHKADHYGWVVLVRHDSNTAGERTLKIRNIAKKEDAEVELTELSSWLAAEIRDRDRRRGHLATIPTSRAPRRGTNTTTTMTTITNPDSSMESNRDAPDIRILHPPYKTKRPSRHTILDTARSRTDELTKGMLASAPIAAIETSEEILDEMRDTRLHDVDSWRALIQRAPMQERRYLQQVVDLLREMAGGGGGAGGVFIFNYRTRGCIYYDIGAGGQKA
jgi:eukaryotic translation initiation factor 2-alpha kinase 4